MDKLSGKAQEILKSLGIEKTTGLIEPTDMISSNWNLGSATLDHDVAAQFIVDIVEQYGFLKQCKQINTKKTILDMKRYKIDERMSYRPTQDASTPSTAAQRANIENVGLQAILKRMMTVSYIDYDTIEDNVDAGEDFVLSLVENMLTTQRANDEADLAMNGTDDTWSAGYFLTNNVGFPTLAKENTSVYEVYTGGSISTQVGVLEAMWDELPAKRKRDPNLAYGMNVNDFSAYRREIGAKEGMGFVFVTGEANKSEGIPIVVIDYLEEGTYFLANFGKNFGVVHNLNMKTALIDEPEKNVVKAILNQMIDFQFVNPEEVCIAYSGTPNDLTATPAATTFGTAGLSVAITTPGYNEDENASIYYTTNGSTPDTSDGTLYSAAITLTATTVLKARSYKNGRYSSTLQATYTSS